MYASDNGMINQAKMIAGSGRGLINDSRGAAESPYASGVICIGEPSESDKQRLVEDLYRGINEAVNPKPSNCGRLMLRGGR